MSGTDAPKGPLIATPLRGFHVAHGAHLVPFAGWEMPLYYDSILGEHQAVRSSAGLFDVSHMGILTVRGASAAALLGRRTTAAIARLEQGQARYTFLLDLEGKMLDDLLVTRLDPGGDAIPTFLAVPNAANAARIYDLLRQHRRPDTIVSRWNGAVSILALQGPRSLDLLKAELGWSLDGLGSFRAAVFPDGPESRRPVDGRLIGEFPDCLSDGILVSRTGYTGERGVEMFVRSERAIEIADRLLLAGARPVGLGARDSLRMEKGFLLSGQDFHQDRTPLEAGQDRFVDLGHDFVGRDALRAQLTAGIAERFTGLVADEAGAIPRHGTPILEGETVVARATSGGTAPTLGRAIALAYLPDRLRDVGHRLAFDIRGRRAPATVAKLPFVPSRPPGAGVP